MRLLPLIAATYFMVSGGPYGIEDILGGAGFGRAIINSPCVANHLVVTHSLDDRRIGKRHSRRGRLLCLGRRALGPFWGFQEGWLSLSASIFDMALYPTIFVLYLGKFSPALTAGGYGYGWSLAVVAVSILWNLRGAPAVGEGSIGLFVLLLMPFAVFVVLGTVAWHCSPSPCAIGAAPTPALRSQPQFSSPCGTTWGGITLPPSHRKSRIRSAIILAR